MKRYLILPFLGLMINVQAQQDAVYTHYMYNTLVVNPAYAGSRDALTMTGLGRFQWAGFSGAPMTQTFTAHAPVAWKSLGLGISAVNDKIGLVNTTSLYIDVAYRLKLSEKSRLSIGLKGGFNNYNARLSSAQVIDQNDNSFSADRTGYMPNAGVGIYYQSEKFYAGVSVPKVVENKFKANGVYVGSEQRCYYFIAGGIIDLNPRLKLKPTALGMLAQGGTAQINTTVQLFIDDLFNIGAMYRSQDAVGIIAGINVTEQLLLSYSYDFSVSNRTAKYNNGSHEILLRYDLIFKKEKRIKSPRYF